MAKIQIKGKLRTMYNMDDTVAYSYIDIPELARKHCDMGAFRQHKKYGGYANSDLFPGMLRGIHSGLFPRGYVRMDQVPEGVTVDTSGFLAVVSWDV